MGLLTIGTPLSWESTEKYKKYIKESGIIQFINHYQKVKDRNKDYLLWGDEIEYTLVKFDHSQQKVFLLLKASEVLNKIQNNKTIHETAWHPEYSAYAIEGVPENPYGHLMGHFNTVESNMKLRRKEIINFYLEEDETILTITAFPRLGSPNFTFPVTHPDPLNSVSKSLFFPDEAIQSEHPRFKTLTRNIRKRRGKKVAINIPIFIDENTPQPFIENLSIYGDIDGISDQAKKENNVYLDAMGFGMGCGCLQTTFQACNIEEARILYDHLTPLCPILMALSASMPIIRGYLLDIDCRWDMIAASVDDRTDEELGIKELKEQQFRINKSRYDSVDCYLSADGEEFIDEDVVIDEEFYQKLRNNNIDHLLAQHISHLFIRDPICLFSERIKLDNETETDHFENIQSTNWQSMRFKLPPPNSSIGWRIEFRPMDLQFTDFENAAYVTFVVLVTRVILTMKLNFLIPISKVNENMHTAVKRDAVRKEKFYFRKGEFITTRSTPPETAEVCDRKRSCSESQDKMQVTPENCYIALSINEIVNGGDNFPGLVPLIRQFLKMVETDVDTMCTISQYLNLIEKRASGNLLTTASWIREFVHNHPDYGRDSIVTEKINYDLFREIQDISECQSKPPSLLPNYISRTTAQISKATTSGEQYLNSVHNSHFNSNV